MVTAQAESQQRILAGRGEGSADPAESVLSEASVLLRKIGSFGDPRLYALSLVAEHLAHSTQPLVPERVFVAGGNGDNGQAASAGQGLLGMLINLLVAEKSGSARDTRNGEPQGVHRPHDPRGDGVDAAGGDRGAAAWDFADTGRHARGPGATVGLDLAVSFRTLASGVALEPRVLGL